MQSILREVRSYVLIVVGVFVFSLGLTAFLIPNEIVGGGVAGIATLVYYATGVNTGIVFFGVNTGLILVALRMLGLRFGIKTVVAMVTMTLLLSYMQNYFTEPVLEDLLLSTILGGVFCGIGLAIVFNEGGSTGGTDIIAMVINRYRDVSLGKVILGFDILIISSSYFVFGSFEKIVYGFVWMGVTAYALDLYLSGAKQSFQLCIFSPKHEEIAEYISATTGRGVTLFPGTGWYSKENVTMLMTVVRKRDTPVIFRAIKMIDADTFISQSSVRGVFGQGFGQIKY